MQLAHKLMNYTRIVIFFAMITTILIGNIKGFCFAHPVDIVLPDEIKESEDKRKYPGKDLEKEYHNREHSKRRKEIQKEIQRQKKEDAKNKKKKK